MQASRQETARFFSSSRIDKKESPLLARPARRVRGQKLITRRFSRFWTFGNYNSDGHSDIAQQPLLLHEERARRKMTERERRELAPRRERNKKKTAAVTDGKRQEKYREKERADRKELCALDVHFCRLRHNESYFCIGELARETPRDATTTLSPNLAFLFSRRAAFLYPHRRRRRRRRRPDRSIHPSVRRN